MHSINIIPIMTKERTIVKSVTKRNRKSRKQMSNVWVVRLTCVSRVIETVCSVFMSVSVIHCNVCAYVAMLEHYEIHLWFQGLWKHVSVITNVIYIAYSCYCLVVLSISLITAFICDVFMWFWWQFVLVSFHFWSIKSINIDLDVWNLACLMGQWFLFSYQ